MKNEKVWEDKGGKNWRRGIESVGGDYLLLLPPL